MIPDFNVLNDKPVCNRDVETPDCDAGIKFPGKIIGGKACDVCLYRRAP